MIAACDIDLRKVYCIREDGGIIYNGDPGPPPIPSTVDLLLCEIASPTSFGRGGAREGTMFNLAKWAIYNVSMITWLDAMEPARLLVAPSNVWTKGYTAKARQALAGATAKNHDLRECQAMIYMYKLDPKPWVSLTEYLENL